MRKHNCVCPICTTLSRGRAKFTCMSLDDLCHLWTVWSINRTQGVTMIRFILTVLYTSFSGQGVSHALQYIIGKGRGKSENFSLHKRYYCRLTESDQVKGFFSVIDLQYIQYWSEENLIPFGQAESSVWFACMEPVEEGSGTNQTLPPLLTVQATPKQQQQQGVPVRWSDFLRKKLDTRPVVPYFSTPNSKISLLLLFLALQDLSNLN